MNELGFTMNGADDRQITTREVGAVSATARAEAEVKAAVALARMYPRSEIAAWDRIRKACGRVTFADNATYSFPRGGQEVSGPSVELARELARCWGNVRYGMRIVSLDDDYAHVTGYAFDVESNSYVESEAKFRPLVQRRRDGKTQWVNPDERDLRELINRHAAICVRNAILQVIPSDVVDAALIECKKTLRSAAEGKLKHSKEEVIRELVAAFDSIGVSVGMIEKRLGHDLSLIDADEITTLRGIFKSIRDGNTGRGEHFEVNKAASESKPLPDRKGETKPEQGSTPAQNAPGEAESQNPASEEPQTSQNTSEGSETAPDATEPQLDPNREAMEQDWSDAKRVLIDASKGKASRALAESAIGKWVLSKGKKGRESSIDVDDRVGLLVAIQTGAFDFETGKIVSQA